MNFFRKIMYDFGLKKTEHTYHMKGKKLYRLKQYLWKDDEWVEDDYSLSLILRMDDGDRCIIKYTDYGCIGSKMMYLFCVHNDYCTYSSEGILVDLSKDYKQILGYYPKKLFYTKTKNL